MSAPPPAGSFSLFPKDSARPPSRSQNQRPRAVSPQTTQEPASATESPSRDSPSRTGRHTGLGRKQSIREGKMPASNGRDSAMDDRMSPLDGSTAGPSIIQRPEPVADIPPRSDTAFSEAQTLVRSNSNRSRSSIAKRPLSEMPQPQEAMRSIFPQYNPELPLDRQNYYPTQTSPSHVPPGAISRHLYSPTEEREETQSQRVVSPVPVRSPPMSGASSKRWPPRSQEPPIVPPPSTNEELRGFWKVANGWKAPGSEGRVYVMKLTGEKDAPMYNLSSATQPLYSVRLDPTSTSAYVSVARYDPTKAFKGPVNPPAQSASGDSPTGSKSESSKSWQEVLTTTLEEESRRHPPEDGLVALLYPTAAAKMALDRPSDITAVMTAERECARLVWDEDTANHYLVHPALAMPFCITIERSPAWSRTEYTLEHLESPQHIARLTRDGTGGGWLEVDTGIAAKIDAVYIVDVAVAALMLVAHADTQYAQIETFEPPPVFGSPGGSLSGRQERRMSRMSKMSSARRENSSHRHHHHHHHGGSSSNGNKAAGGGAKRSRSRMEEFELDIESQTSDFKKLDVRDRDKDKEKLPTTARALIKLLTITFKCLIWCATIAFKALAAIIGGLARCLTSDKV